MRRYIQYIFLAFNIYIGIRLYYFYTYFVFAGGSPLVDRPASAEAYLPIAALIGLKYWLLTGVFDRVHPAGVVIFGAALATTLLWRRGFCSWICPIGTVSEMAHRAGDRFGLNVRPPRYVDIPLRSIKYVILLFFLIIVGGMGMPAMSAFMDSPYYKIADIKMLLFFLSPSLLAIAVLLNLVVWSFFIKNFWCRYLCPYGALLALVSKAGLVRIERNAASCIDCKKCDRACPSYIKPAETEAVTSLECIECMDCIEVCPVEETLEVKGLVAKKTVGIRAYGIILVASFMLVVTLAQLTGYWKTNVSMAEYRQLVPNADRYSHP